jgi:hypothetical protein
VEEREFADRKTSQDVDFLFLFFDASQGLGTALPRNLTLEAMSIMEEYAECEV